LLLGIGLAEACAAVEIAACTERGALVARVTDRREQETDAEFDVSFADPDDAVEERVRELGLSSAALDVDETIRASKTADSNVREVVEERVSALLDSDRDAFSPASDAPPGDESADVGTEATATDGVDEAAEADATSDASTETASDATAESAGDADTETEGDDEDDEDDEEDAESERDAGSGETDTEPSTSGPKPTDGQVTMEDF
jgi:phosphopantothenoylcysteine synthetase/decarboxylase